MLTNIGKKQETKLDLLGGLKIMHECVFCFFSLWKKGVPFEALTISRRI